MNILSLSTLTNSFNSVKLSGIKVKYQEKKQRAQEQELTAQQRERQSVIDKMQEQAEADRKNAKIASIEAKFKSSGSLSADEIAYMQKERPGYYEELLKQRAEAESYEKALKSCNTKEDVSSVHMVKLSQFMTEANAICNNPVIPKGKKLELMMKLEDRLEGVSKVQTEFTTSEDYARLPSIYDKEEPAPAEEEKPVEKEQDAEGSEKTDTAEKPDSSEKIESAENTDTSAAKPAGDSAEGESTAKPEKAAETATPARKKPASVSEAEPHRKKPAAKKAVKADAPDAGEVQHFISYEIERLRGFKSKQVDVKV